MPWWMWVISVIAYGGIWRFAFRWLWENEPEKMKTWKSFRHNVFFATVFFWLVVPVAILDYISTRSGPDRVVRLLAGESRAAKRERQKRELAEHEQRVAQAERELGIE